MDSWILWSLGLFAAGLLITVLEIMIPSGGLLGLAALGCLIGSLACAYQHSGTAAAVLAGIEVVSVPGVVVLGFKILPKTSVGRKMILSPPAESSGSAARPDGGDPAAKDEFGAYLGAEGVVVTALRPSGTVEFDGRRVSVVSDGEAIPEGSRVRVVLVEGNRVVVDTLKE